jgi:glycerol kinase
MPQYILAIDQGTTGTTALVFDEGFTIHGKHTVEFPQHFPKPSWVEHDLEEIWASVRDAVNGALSQARCTPGWIAAIGITNQRETTCLWRREPNAPPLGRAIVWQDRRTSDVCEKLKKRGLEKSVNRKTGLLLDPYFSATKLQWMLKNVSGASAAAKAGKLAFGTIDSYLLYRMSGAHATDVTNASRTLLMDLKTQKWDDDLLKLFGVPKSVLPEILPSAVEYGRTKGFLDFADGTPITGIAGDQQAALFGQACFQKGSAKCTYGTGAFILMNTGEKPVFSKHRLLTTIAWKLGNKTTYGLEGSAFIAGAAVQWLRDGLGLISKSAEVEALAASVPDSGGVVMVPALSGLGAPYWWPNATGIMTGITRGTTKAHVARATLEGMAFQVSELLEAMGKDGGKRPAPIKVDGGASANDLLMQFQADLMGVKVVRSQILETTALGSGIQAGLAVGYWKNLDEVAKKWKAAKSFEPSMKAPDRAKAMERWRRALKAVQILSAKS